MSSNLDHLPDLSAAAHQPSSPFPNWHLDPLGVGAERFWNGRDWTEQVRGEPAPPPLAVEDIVVVPDPEPVVVPDPEPVVLPDPEPVVDVNRAPEPQVSLFSPVTARAADPRPVPDQPSLYATTRRVTIPVPDVAPARRSFRDAPPQPRRLAGILLAVALGILGAVVGYAIGNSRAEDAPPSPLAGAEVAASAAPRLGTVERQGAAVTGQATGEQATGEAVAGESAVELEQMVRELRGQLEATELELEALATQRDNVAEHNQLLQTWFTPAIVERSQQEWDAEVARACGLVAEGATLENSLLNYSRSLEVIGTVGDLAASVEVCVNG